MMRRLAIRWSVSVAVWATVVSPCEATERDVSCSDQHVVAIRRLRYLLPGVREAVGAMADVGEPFQVTDALSGPDHLPWRRFQMATAIGCRVHVDYEFGGRAHGIDGMELKRVDGSWRKIVSDSLRSRTY